MKEGGRWLFRARVENTTMLLSIYLDRHPDSLRLDCVTSGTMNKETLRGNIHEFKISQLCNQSIDPRIARFSIVK